MSHSTHQRVMSYTLLPFLPPFSTVAMALHLPYQWETAHTQSRSTNERVTSHIKESCMCVGVHMSMSHACVWGYTCQWVLAHISMGHGTHITRSSHTYHGVMAHISMSHGTHINESWHRYQWVMAQISMSHGTDINESWHRYQWVMAQISMSHGTRIICTMVHMQESCHISMRHGTYIKESWHTWKSHVTYQWVKTHTLLFIITHINESWHICNSHSTHPRVMPRAFLPFLPPTTAVAMSLYLIYQWVMAHIWKSHGTHERVTSHIKESRHVMKESSHERVKSWHTWKSHVIARSHGTHERVTWHIKESRHTPCYS